MILVTGGTGAIGGEVVRLLSQAGTPSRAPIRNPNQRQEFPAISIVPSNLLEAERQTPLPCIRGIEKGEKNGLWTLIARSLTRNVSGLLVVA
jgi:nucleoside-diphosphate-sugar epimerase